MSPYLSYRRQVRNEKRQTWIDAFIVGAMFGTGLGLSLLAGLFVGHLYYLIG